MYYKQPKIQSRGGVSTSQVQRTLMPQKIHSNRSLPKEKEVSKKDLQKQLQIMQVRLDNIYTILIRACIQSEKPKSNYQNP